MAIAGLDGATIGNILWPVIRTFVFSAFGLAITIAFGYYFFIVKRRRTWYVDIYEIKSANKLHLIGKDKIIEKKVRGGVSLFILQKKKLEVLPPPDHITYRLGNKEYCSYIRLESEYMPMEEYASDYGDELSFIKKIKRGLIEIRNSKREHIYEKYMYAPVNKLITNEVITKPMEYDVNLLRISSLEVRQKAYADKMTFLQKWGALIGIGIVAVLLIVALYLSYEFAQNVIGQALGAADKVATPLANIASKLTGTAPAG